MGGKGRRGARLVQQLPVVLQSCECEVVRRGKAGCCGVAGRRPFSSALWGVPQKHRIRVPRPPGSCRGPDPPVYLCRRPTATGDFVQFAPEAAAAQHWPRDHGAWTGPAAAETAGTEVRQLPWPARGCVPGSSPTQSSGGQQRALPGHGGGASRVLVRLRFLRLRPGVGLGPRAPGPQPRAAVRAGPERRHLPRERELELHCPRAGRLHLSGSCGGALAGCRDAWASEALLVVLRDARGTAPGPELQAWAPGSALTGEPLWAQTLELEAEREDRPGAEAQAGGLPLLPGARAYVSPRPPLCRPLAPELRARRLDLGAEHALLLDELGCVFSWGGGRHGQLGHGTLEAVPEPRLLEALQGLPMAGVAAGGWHSVCVSETGDIYIWGWNESGQLALPTRSLAEDKKTVAGQATGQNEDGSEENKIAEAEDGAPATFISVQPFPALLDLPLGSDAVKASCGSRHTAVVTRTGELYTWGWGKYGQLGHKDTTSWDRPCRVEYFVDKQLQVMAVSCGPWNTYVYAVEKEKS